MDWTTIFISVAVGIGTGVAANLSTYIFVNVWLPSIRNYTYQGINLSGNWVITQPSTTMDNQPLSVQWVLSVSLQQKAYVISGQATASTFSQKGACDSISYEVSGHIYDRFVSITLRNRDTSRIAYSTFLLEVEGDGRTMTGYRSFYGFHIKKIRCIQSTWRRGTHIPA